MGDSRYIRDLKMKLLAEWNGGRSKDDILDRYPTIRISTLESAARNALKEGLYVREPEMLFPFKAEKRPEKIRGPSSRQKCPAGRALERRKQNCIVNMRPERDAVWWTNQLPKSSRQCRWPRGDLFTGTLCCCKREREDADTVPLGLDMMPYCTGHRNKARGKGNRARDAETNRRNAVRFRNELALT
ncbi:hypothetical protein HY413_03700 [Candidatus Kaiserbacteria bacterium]|nr:hypothetical protein [Candidatus Kaiserbacteria bacterium]